MRRRGKGFLQLWGIEKHVTSAGNYRHGNVQTIKRKASEFHSCLPEHHCVDVNSFRVASDFSPIQLVDTRVPWISPHNGFEFSHTHTHALVPAGVAL